MIRENGDDHHLENSADKEASQHARSIGWVNKNPVVHSWDSSSSDGDYMVMAIKRKRVTELKVAGAQLPIKVNGKALECGSIAGPQFQFSPSGNCGKLWEHQE